MAGQQYIGTGRLGASQDVAYTATAGTSTAIGTQTYKVRVIVTTAARIKIASSAAAVATDTYMAAGAAENFSCTPGQTVSAIRVASDGTMNVTELE